MFHTSLKNSNYLLLIKAKLIYPFTNFFAVEMSYFLTKLQLIIAALLFVNAHGRHPIYFCFDLCTLNLIDNKF